MDRKEAALIAAIFVFTLALHAVDIDKPYETWDEITTYSVGLNLWYNIAHLDFSPDSWSASPHPPFARYAYGLVNGVYLVSQRGLSVLNSGYDTAVMTMYELKNFVPGRALSAVLAALTSVMAFLISRNRFGLRIAASAAFMFAALPAVLAQTRIATIDAMLVFMFTLSVCLFVKGMKNKKWFYASAVVAGLTLSTKLNAIFLFLLLPFVYYAEGGRFRRIDAVIYPMISVVAFFASWPRLWSDPIGFITGSVSFWTGYTNISEFFLGSLQHPFYYALAYVAVTTPVIILALLAVGVLKASKFRECRTFLAWLFVPLLAYTALLMLKPETASQGGARYVFMTYPALAILAAIGLDFVAKSVSRSFSGNLHKISYAAIPVLVAVCLIATAAAVHPYYLDYYNEIAGGPHNVYKNRLFAFGGLGEGISAAADYVNTNAPHDATVQFFVMPRHVVQPLRSDITDLNPYIPSYVSGAEAEVFMNSTEPTADYIVENVWYKWYEDPSLDNKLADGYRLASTADVAGAPLAWVYAKS